MRQSSSRDRQTTHEKPKQQDLNLTLVEKDPVEMGRRAAKLLLEKIQKKQSSMGHYTLMPTTFVRGSEKFPWRNPNLRTFPQLESK